MSRFRLMMVVWLAVLAGLGPLCAASAPAPARAPVAQPGKYLFLVEATADLSRRSEAVALTVADLIERGLGGRMQAGDLFTILPYNERVDSKGHARKTWDPAQSRQISNLAFLYLQKYRFEKPSRFDRVMALVQQAVESERDLTVYIVGSGDDLFSGTPFDEEINKVLQARLGEWRARGAIVVVALVAERGRLRDWAVGTTEPPAPTRLIARKPEEPKPAPKTNAVAEVKPPPPPPKTNQVAAVKTNDVAVVKPPPTTPPKTNAVTEAKPPTIPAKTNQVTTTEVPPPKPPEKTNVVAEVKPVAPPPPPPPPKTNSVAEIKPKPPEVTPPKTTNPVVEIKPVPVVKTNTVPLTKTNDIAVIKPPVAPAQTNQSTVAEITPPKPATSTNAVVVNPPKPPPATNSVTTVQSKPPEVTPPKPLIPAVTQAVAVVVATGRTEKVEATNPVAATPPAVTNKPTQPTVIAITPEPGPRPYGMIVAGVGLLILAAWLAWIWHRRTRPAASPSLITQSMNRDPQKKGPE